MKDANVDLKVAVAMSGGVDSSVTAILCTQEYGKENVFGVTMKLFSCVENSAINDAKTVCQKLGIVHHIIDLESKFKEDIIDDFISEYERGITPNPCVRCNKLIKFGTLLENAKELGADKLATGHYAKNIFEPEKGKYHLLKGTDVGKDQSYFLYTLTQSQLGRVIFPLGELRKPEVRDLVKEFGFDVVEREESQDICFVPEEVEDFLKDKAASKEGNIILKDGRIIGKHSGLAFYTIGQRKGLGGGFAKPMYVVGLNSEKNEIVVGEENELYANELNLKDINWISGDKPIFPFFCSARIRYQAKEAECTVLEAGNNIKVTFKESQKAITKGQSVVFYQGKEVVGGGTIY